MYKAQYIQIAVVTQCHQSLNFLHKTVIQVSRVRAIRVIGGIAYNKDKSKAMSNGGCSNTWEILRNFDMWGPQGEKEQKCNTIKYPG